MKHKVCIGLLAVLLLLSAVPLFAGGKTEASAAGKSAEFNPADYPLAIVMILKGHPVHRIVQTGFLTKAKELGYPAEILACEGSGPAESIALAEAGVGKGVKGRLVWAVDQSYYPFMTKAANKGVKIVVPHFPIPENDCPGLAVNLSADPYRYGQEAAKAIGDAIGGKTGSIGITQGSFNLTENKAAQGFRDYIVKNYPNLKALDPIEEGFDPPAAIAKIAALIQANPDILGGFGTTGGSPVTWNGAMIQTNRKELFVIGMDYTEQNIDLVKQGKIFGIVAQPLYEEAQKSVELLDRLLRGEKPEYFMPLDAPVVTKDGIGKYEEIMKQVAAWFK